MTATKEQIVAEAERRWLEQYKAYGGRLPGVGWSLIDHVIEVTREGWAPPEPVDPDLLAVREVLAREYEKRGWSADARAVLRGKPDGRVDIAAALAAYEAGRAAR